MNFLNKMPIKKVLSLLLTLTFIYLCVTKKVNAQEFLPVYTLIIGYYFGEEFTQHDKN